MKYQALTPLRFRGTDGRVVEVMPGETFTTTNEKGIGALIEAGKARPYWKVFEQLFREHMSWMQSYPTTIDETKQHNPETSEELLSLSKAMDVAWFREDLSAFKLAMQRLETLYLKVHEQITGKGATK